VKIDQSFVRDLTVDPDDAAIVTAIVAMARSLGVDVVGRGRGDRGAGGGAEAPGLPPRAGLPAGRPMGPAEAAALIGVAAERQMAPAD
jgi:predicted signal transduction protein with EAL and GGDEF domain